MSRRPGKRLTRRSAARALDRAGTSGDRTVDGILAAAAAPSTDLDPAREHAAVAAFQAARLGTAASAEGLTTIQVARKRAAAAKVTVAAAAAVLLAGGGVAFAASTGNLPEVLGGDHRSENGSERSSRAPGQQGTAAPGTTPTGPAGPSSGPTPRAGTPDPSYRGLCNAFQKRSATNPGKAADSAAFTALAAAAGGKENIATYCVALIGVPGSRPTEGPTAGGTEQPGAGPSARPTHPAHPVHPTRAANPTKGPKTPNPNKPTAKPTKAPNPNKPTDGPTAKPSKAPNPNKPTKTPAS